MSAPPFQKEPPPIPQAALDNWASIPMGKPLSIAVTKQQVEDLYWCLRDTMEAQAHIRNALIHYSNNNMGYANQAATAAQDKLIESQTTLSLLISFVMETAMVKK